jgi:carbon monoxide dehydrogenase subunit G
MPESTVELDEYSFTLPVPAGRAWDVLLDVAMMALCVPGAVLDWVDGETVHGRLTIATGPMNHVHKGTGRFTERDKAAGILVFQAAGEGNAGAGTWHVTIRTALTDGGHETRVRVRVTVRLTGSAVEVSPDVVGKVGRQLTELSATNLVMRLGGPGKPVPVRVPRPEDHTGRRHESSASSAVIEVAIGPAQVPGMLGVEVVSSPAGEASAIAALDVGTLLARRRQLQQAVRASAMKPRTTPTETEQPVRAIGQALFTCLLGTGEVAGRYRAASALATERVQRLRVVLRIDSPALAALPWEAMYDEAAGVYVCRQDQLVRHVRVSSMPAPLLVRPPLRILGVAASPPGLPALDVRKEQYDLTRALAGPISQGHAEVHWVPEATWDCLHDVLLDGPWHVVHFIGHGAFNANRDGGHLVLVGEDGRAREIAAHVLADLLHQASPMPRLVVLNSCSGGAASTTDLFSSAAAELVRRGISAVAAMQYSISDLAAIAFARGFYTAVAHGRGIDEAVSSGRVAILGTSNDTLEWLTPVLYLRGRDAHLFRF